MPVKVTIDEPHSTRTVFETEWAFVRDACLVFLVPGTVAVRYRPVHALSGFTIEDLEETVEDPPQGDASALMPSVGPCCPHPSRAAYYYAHPPEGPDPEGEARG